MKTYNTKLVVRVFAIIAAALALGGCSRAPVVTLTNDSTATASNVVVSGPGFSESVGNIAPGAEHKLTVHPSARGGFRLEFDADGRHVDRVTPPVSTNNVSVKLYVR